MRSSMNWCCKWKNFNFIIHFCYRYTTKINLFIVHLKMSWQTFADMNRVHIWIFFLMCECQCDFSSQPAIKRFHFIVRYIVRIETTLLPVSWKVSHRIRRQHWKEKSIFKTSEFCCLANISDKRIRIEFTFALEYVRCCADHAFQHQ